MSRFHWGARPSSAEQILPGGNRFQWVKSCPQLSHVRRGRLHLVARPSLAEQILGGDELHSIMRPSPAEQISLGGSNITQSQGHKGPSKFLLDGKAITGQANFVAREWLSLPIIFCLAFNLMNPSSIDCH